MVMSKYGGAKVQVTGYRSGYRLQATGHRSAVCRVKDSSCNGRMLPPKGHEANPSEVFQAVVQQNERKWQAFGRRAEKYGPATIQEAEIAVSEVLSRLYFNTAVFCDWYEARATGHYLQKRWKTDLVARRV